MLKAFLACLNPMLMLFICMAIGFILKKTNILPESAGVVIAKMETWVFCPALSFITMARNCTIENLTANLQIVFISTVLVIIAVIVAILLSRAFVKTKSPERGVYQYALTFANHGFLGDPLALALFGEPGLFLYKLFTLPMNILTYTWGLSVLIPSGERSNPLKKLLNTTIIATFLGMAVGLLGVTDYIPVFISDTFDKLSSCMGPLAMILAGFTVARFDFIEMLKNKKVYIATAHRLLILPAVYLGTIILVKNILYSSFGIEIRDMVIYLAFIGYAAPLGLNTVVFPEAYGGNPKTGASMAMISHTLCVITIPLMYALLTMILG